MNDRVHYNYSYECVTCLKGIITTKIQMDTYSIEAQWYILFQTVMKITDHRDVLSRPHSAWHDR